MCSTSSFGFISMPVWNMTKKMPNSASISLVLELAIGPLTASAGDGASTMVTTGFVPSPLGRVTDYVPTAPEIAISVGVYAVGCLVLTVLYKVALGIRERSEVTT